MAVLSKVRQNYKEEDLVKAVEAVKEHKMTTREAAKCFNKTINRQKRQEVRREKMQKRRKI